MIKTIILDIDGTLLNSCKVITERTKQALLKAQENGCRLVIASGRPPRGLIRFGKELDMDNHHGVFICYNGSLALDCQSGEVFYDQAMSVEDCKAVLHHLKQFNVQVMIAHDRHMYVENVYAGMINTKTGLRNIIDFEAHSNNYMLCEEDDLEAFVNFPLNKILTLGDPAYMQDHYREMREPFKDTLSSMFTAPFYYEFMAKGIDKAKAIRESLLKLGYTPDEMIAFGDAQNDISMLEYAGIGVAMENAVEETKRAADELTLDNDHDGIAAALCRHMPWLE